MEGKNSVNVGEYPSYIFDLDGTLFAIPVDWTAVRRELSSLLGVSMDGAPLFQTVSEMVESSPSLRTRAFAVIDSYELRVVDSATPMPGASELLYALFEASKLALVTMQGRPTAEGILRRNKLADLFEVVVTREDSLDRADQIRMVINSLGVEPSSVLFTGDRLNDVVCGKKAGVDVALVGRTRPQEPKPDYFFRTLAEFQAYLT